MPFISRDSIKFQLVLWAVVVFFNLSLPYCTPIQTPTCQASKCIHIRSTPSAEIFIDGQFIGTTPAHQVGVESGSLIELKAEGYETSLTRLGKVRAQGLAIKKATGHAKISISGNGLNITLKKQSKS